MKLCLGSDRDHDTVGPVALIEYSGAIRCNILNVDLRMIFFDLIPQCIYKFRVSALYHQKIFAVEIRQTEFFPGGQRILPGNRTAERDLRQR